MLCNYVSGGIIINNLLSIYTETADRPGGGNVTDGGQDLSSILEKVHLSENSDQTDASKENSDELGSNTVPTKSDMLVACATHPGTCNVCIVLIHSHYFCFMYFR